MLEIRISDKAKEVFKVLEDNGGKVYVVGGAVRDTLYGLEPSDIDLEIFHLTLDQLNQILSMFGKVKMIGHSFPIVQLDALPDYEFSLPRVEAKNGTRHQDFKIDIKPDMPLKEAAERRDFTINSLMYEYSSGRIYDFFNGLKDLSDQELNIVNKDKFREDPLRVLRAAAFIARYDLTPSQDTQTECAAMVREGLLENLSDERVYAEYSKILMAKYPSAGFTFLRDIDALPTYLKDLVTCHQRLDYHPEGNVFNHTMLVVDLAALVKNRVSQPLSFMWSALLHDIGKPAVTTPEGHAYRHAEVGAELFDKEVKIIHAKKMRSYIHTMIYYHMRIMDMTRNSHVRKITYLRLLKAIEGKVPIEDLMMLGRCDKLGRGNIANTTVIDFDYKMYELMDQFGTHAPVPIITGADLIAHGFKDHRRYRYLLDKAYDMQLRGMGKEKILRSLLNE